MAEPTLIESLVESSRDLLDNLDNNSNSPLKAFWYYYEDADTWKLILSGPSFDKLLKDHEPLAYKIIAEALNQLEDSTLSISDIKLLKLDDQLVRLVHFLVRTKPHAKVHAVFSDLTANGVFIKDVYIIRSARLEDIA